MSTTDAQINANRANATLSTGPVTDAGKQVSSRNSYKHGLTARQIVLPGEDPEAYQALRDSLVREFEPRSTDEAILVEHYAEHTWRYQRMLRMESAFLTNRIKALQADNPDLTPDEAGAMLFVDEVESKKLKLFMRYLAAAERAYNKAFKDLSDVIKARPSDDDPDDDNLAALYPMPPVGFVSHDAPKKLPWTLAPAKENASRPPVKA